MPGPATRIVLIASRAARDEIGLTSHGEIPQTYSTEANQRVAHAGQYREGRPIVPLGESIRDRRGERCREAWAGHAEEPLRRARAGPRASDRALPVVDSEPKRDGA